jgi:hypothetical protein
MASNNPSAGIKSLVESIKKHKNFKQLATYSIQSLTQAIIEYDNRDFEANLKECMANSGPDALVGVLQKHVTHEGIIEDACKCLTCMATSKEYSSVMVKSGLLDAFMNCISKGNFQTDTSVIPLIFGVILKMATFNPEEVLGSTDGGGMVKFLFSLIEANTVVLKNPVGNPTWIYSALQILFDTVEKLSNAPNGVEEVCGQTPSGGIVVNNFLKVEAERAENQENAGPVASNAQTPANVTAIQTCFNLLLKITGHEAGLKELQDIEAMDVVLEVIDAHSSVRQIMMVGSKIVAKLEGDDAANDAMAALGGDNGGVGSIRAGFEKGEFFGQSEAEIARLERASQLLSTMAFQRGKADTIVKSGGVSALVRSFDLMSHKTSERAARALARLATVNRGVHASAIVKSGAVKALAASIQAQIDANALDSSCVALTNALVALASSPEIVNEMHKQGVIGTVMQCLEKFPEHINHSTEALKFIECLAQCDFDMQEVLEANAIQSVMASMRIHKDNVQFQQAGLRALMCLAINGDAIDVLMENNAIDLITANLTDGCAHEPEVVANSLYLLTSMGLKKANIPQISQSGVITHALQAIYLNSTNEEVRETAAEFIEEVTIDCKVIDSTVRAVASSLDNIGKKHELMERQKFTYLLYATLSSWESPLRYISPHR